MQYRWQIERCEIMVQHSGRKVALQPSQKYHHLEHLLPFSTTVIEKSNKSRIGYVDNSNG